MFNTNWGTGGLVLDDFKTWDTEKYKKTENSLDLIIKSFGKDGKTLS